MKTLNLSDSSNPRLRFGLSLTSLRSRSAHRALQSVSATPEEEEELKRVEKWVEMMADMDNEEVDHMLAWKPRLSSMKK